MTGSKVTRAGIRVTQAYTVAAVSAFFDCRRRRRDAVASPAQLPLITLVCVVCVLVGPDLRILECSGENYGLRLRLGFVCSSVMIFSDGSV